MHILRRRLIDWLVPAGWRLARDGGAGLPITRAKPGQSLDAVNMLYAQGPDATRYLAQYALNVWVFAAVSRLAEGAAAAALEVVDKKDPVRKNDNHPLLALLGEYGRPNDSQDTLEFLEDHFTFLELCGNSYWYWFAPFGGAPTEVHLLHPTKMHVVPGRDRNVAGYLYRHGGREFPLSVESVTHFRRPNPYNSYYGLPALEAIMIEVLGDRAAAEWNLDFFGDGVSLPVGIFVIPSNVPDKERDRLDIELNAKHSQRRKTAVVRADPGGTVWHDGGLRQRDLDFKEGRMLSRQAVFDALQLPPGLMADSSTEAHARVAERQFSGSVMRRLNRTSRKLNSDVMGFWPASQVWKAAFEDLHPKYADWEQESKKLAAVRPYMTVDEVRATYFGLGPMPQEEVDRRLEDARDRLTSATTEGPEPEAEAEEEADRFTVQ